jgi:hypothetical protein
VRGCQLVRVDSAGVEFTLARMAALGDKLVDKRVLERNMTKGLVSKEQYEQYLADLTDSEGNSERVQIESADAEKESQTE